VKKSTYAVAVDGSFIVVMGIVMIIIQALL
jgi:hypothetical protein